MHSQSSKLNLSCCTLSVSHGKQYSFPFTVPHRFGLSRTRWFQSILSYPSHLRYILVLNPILPSHLFLGVRIALGLSGCSINKLCIYYTTCILPTSPTSSSRYPEPVLSTCHAYLPTGDHTHTHLSFNSRLITHTYLSKTPV